MSGRSYGGTAAVLRSENEKFACERIRLSRVQSKKWVRSRNSSGSGPDPDRQAGGCTGMQGGCVSTEGQGRTGESSVVLTMHTNIR